MCTIYVDARGFSTCMYSGVNIMRHHEMITTKHNFNPSPAHPCYKGSNRVSHSLTEYTTVPSLILKVGSPVVSNLRSTSSYVALGNFARLRIVHSVGVVYDYDFYRYYFIVGLGLA